ncbi:MAG: carboxymuconolactone decarboxylase family protein [Bradyrhizobiaceae bacterium]|nr:carboxymuconolactone decarboxylase family protein [Bradyrhizobiaceae bacterium]
MSQRIDYKHVAPDAFRAMLNLEQYLHTTDLDPLMIHLVKLRASQLNGCAYCLDMHAKDARVAGATEQQVYMISAWREAPCYSGKLCAALLWTEALTRLDGMPVDDSIYHAVREHFAEAELVQLTMVIIAINGWNRLSVGFQTPAGTYQPVQQ